MKNRLLALLLLMATLLSVTSCGIIFGDVAEQGDITVVVENTNGSFEVYKTYLENVENKSEGAKGVIADPRRFTAHHADRGNIRA